MVAVVEGSGLGLFNTSTNVLSKWASWGSAALGQDGGRAYVNAATGNLVLRSDDEVLSGRGVDLHLLRTYNSLGDLSTDVDGDGWRWDGERTVKFDPGAQRATPGNGGTVTRTAGDGSITVYTWNSVTRTYVSTEGGGAHDSLSYAANRWTWVDGSTRQTELYGDSTSTTMTGRLLSQTDTSGNSIRYEYDAGNRLTRIVDSGNGQSIELVYSTTTPARLSQVNTYELAGGGTSPIKQVEYAYVGNHLDSVRTVLNPGEATSRYFVTKYNYVGSQLMSMVQNDGTAAGGGGTPFTVDFTYDASGRIASVTDANGTQSFVYHADTHSTDVVFGAASDASAPVWTYTYDAVTSQLVKVQAPLVAGARPTTQFFYDNAGNVTKTIDANDKATIYQYDANGNCILERDQLGNTLSRTYGSKNELLTETRYLTPDAAGLDEATIGIGSASGGLTTRYVYDGNARLRFVITAEGRVSESRYGTNGLIERSLGYVADLYTQSASTEADLAAWAAALPDKSAIALTQYAYDFRGNVSQITRFGKVDAAGDGVVDAAATITQYVYDAHGGLRQTIAVRSSAIELSSVAYDGLGRVILSISGDHDSSTAHRVETVYDDKGGSITVTDRATGLVTVSTHDTRGRLTSIGEAAAGGTRTTRYFYDAQGRLQMTQDAQGQRSYNFYDADGRLQYSVDANGDKSAITGYTYDPDGHVLSQTRYRNTVDTRGWVDSATAPTRVTKSSLTPGSDFALDAANDRVTTYTYDDAGRLSTMSDGVGATTTEQYDGLSRMTAKNTGGRVTRYYYDGDGRLVGTIDPAGYLTENVYDAGGRLVDTVRYASRSRLAIADTAPAWQGVADQVATAGQTFSYRLPAYDADGDALTYSQPDANAWPAWLTLTRDSGGVTLTGKPPATFTSAPVTIRATDPAGRTADARFTITVVGSTPTWGALPDATVAVNSTVNIVLPPATTTDGGALTYSAVGLPHGLTLTGNTITGTPDTPTAATVMLTARDSLSGKTVTRTMTIVVTDNGPTWAPFRNQTVVVNEAFRIPVPPAVDPEGEALTYTAVGLPGWLHFDGLTLYGVAPSTAQATQSIQLIASDLPHQKSVVLSFGIAVILGNTPTWSGSVSNQSVEAGSSFQLQLPAASDAAGDTLVYSAEGLPAGLVINPSTGFIQGTTTALNGSDASTVWPVRVYATNPAGQRAQLDFTITVRNARPVYNEGSLQVPYTPQTDETSVLVNLAGAFYDPNGDPLTYSVVAQTYSDLQPVFGLADIRMTAQGPMVDLHPNVLTLRAGTTRTYLITVNASDGRGGVIGGAFRVNITGAVAGLRAASSPASAAAVVASEPASIVAGAPAAIAAPVDVLANLRPADATGLHSRTFYDAQGRVVGTVDEQGLLTTTAYDERLNTQQVTRYLTKVTVGATDTVATLKTRAAAGGSETTTIAFDGQGRTSSTTSADGTVTRSEYDAAGRLVRQISAEGTANQRSSRTFYDAFGEVVGTLGGEGDAALLGRITAAHPALTQQDVDETLAAYGTTYQYDSAGRRVKSVDSHGNATLYFYDGDDRLVYTVNALGEVTASDYNAFGEVSTQTRFASRLASIPGIGGDRSAVAAAVQALVNGANDEVVTTTFDRRGLVLTRTDPRKFVTTYTYDGLGALSTESRGQGGGLAALTVYGYDSRGELVSRTADAGGVNANVQMTYDAYGRVSSTTDATGKVTRTSYGEGDSGRTVTVTDPLNRSSVTAYDVFDRVTSVTDANGKVTRYAYNRAADGHYDASLRRMAVTTPEGVTTATVITPSGETFTVTDGNGNVTTYAYNKDGQLLTVTDALGKVVSRSDYDRGGRVYQTVDALGVVTTLGYDALNRVMSRVVDPNTATHRGENLTTTYAFDHLGRQIQVTQGTGASARITQYTYYQDGRLRAVTVDPAGLKLQTSYVYDGLGNTVSVKQGTAANPSLRATTYVFDKLGRRIQETQAPSNAVTQGYGNDRDLVTQYRYDANGRLTRKIDALGQSTWYVYDDDGELLQTIDALGSVSESSYDAAGRVVATRRYAKALAPDKLAALGDVVAAPVMGTADYASSDQRVDFVYDGDGRLRFTLTAQSQPTGTDPAAFRWGISERRYDASGNVVEQRNYDKAIGEDRINALDANATRGINLSDLQAELKTNAALGYDDANAASLAKVQRTFYAYDADNRLRFTVEGLGGVTETQFDDAGREVASIRYGTAVTGLTSHSLAAIQQAVAGQAAGNRSNQKVLFAYDGGGRQTATAQLAGFDSQGRALYAVTRRTFDVLGQVVRSTSYASTAALPDMTQASLDAIPSSSADRATVFAYDAAGRQVYQLQSLARAGATTPAWVVHRQVFDALGQMVKTIAYATTIADIPANGTDPAKPLDFSATKLDTEVIASSADRVSVQVYDAAGRQRFSIAANGLLSENVYNALGQLTERRQVATWTGMAAPTASSAVPTLTELAAARGAQAVGDGTTRGERYAYDAAGRLISTTDALGFNDRTTYDALGQRATYTDKSGATWTYDYDRLGRVYNEKSPAVLLQLSSESAPARRSIVTRFEYNALGYLVKKTEAAGFGADSRVTSYEYDLLGRQTMVALPGYYDPASGQILPSASVSGAFVRTLKTVYDALGNAVRTDVRTGLATSQSSYKAYDNLGRLSYDVDALGHVTGYGYDAFGDQTLVTRYSVTAGAAPTGNLWNAEALTALVAGDGLARTVVTSYDNLGRKTEVTQAGVGSYYSVDAQPKASAATAPTASATAKTRSRFEYDVFGDLIHEALQINDVGTGNGAATDWRDTWHGYDEMGRETTTLDALGYLTVRSYDGLGNLTRTTEYATKPASGSWPPTLPAASAADHVTGYVYDLLNRQTDVVRYGMRYSVWNTATKSYIETVESPDWGTTVAHTTYDAMGRVRTQADAANQVTTTNYDALGHVASVVAPARQVAAAGSVDPFGNQVTASLTTSFTMNAFGQVVTQVITPGAGTAGAVRTLRQAYDAAGNLVRETDANGNVKTRQYDYAGHVTREMQANTVVLEGWKTVTQNLERRYIYDALGRQTDALDVYTDGTGLKQSGQRSTFNAFGEVIQEFRVWGAGAPGSQLTAALSASYTYDANGHVSGKTAGDGTYKYFYNLAGDLTRVEQRAADSTTVRVTETAYDQLGRAVLVRQPSFEAEVAGSQVRVTSLAQQGYDRWGNVTQRSVGGYVINSTGAYDSTKVATTFFEYDTDNRLTAERQPTVNVRRVDSSTAGGSYYQAKVSHELRYDILGRQVQDLQVADDASTSRNEAIILRSHAMQYDAAGELTASIDSLGNVTRYAYDAQGNRVGTRDAMGFTYVDSFDANGNQVSHAVLRLAVGGQYLASGDTGKDAAGRVPAAVVVANFRYDQANRRVGTADVLSDGRTYWSNSQLDERGLAVATSVGSYVDGGGAHAGRIVSYGYDVLGNKSSETRAATGADAAGATESTQRWEYSLNTSDYSLGRLLSSTSASGKRTTYGYNGFGAVASIVYPRASLNPDNPNDISGVNDRTITFYENGAIKQVVDQLAQGFRGGAGGADYINFTDTTEYTYTVLGQQASESYFRTGNYELQSFSQDGGSHVALMQLTVPDTMRRTHTTYDLLGRIATVSAPAAENPSGSSLQQLAYYYDELGNRRLVQATSQRQGEGQVLDTEWFDYDSEGRMTVVNGGVLNGKFIAKDDEAIRVTYDALGRRVTEERFLEGQKHYRADQDGVEHTVDWYRQEKFTYDDLGYLTQVQQRLNMRNVSSFNGQITTQLQDVEGDWYPSSDREYDVAGRVVFERSYATMAPNGYGSNLGVPVPRVLQTVTTVYNPDGQVASTETENFVNVEQTGFRFSRVDNSYDQAGNLVGYVYQHGQPGQDGYYTNTYRYAYTTDYGGYRNTRIDVTSTQKDTKPSFTQQIFDARGNLVREVDRKNGVTSNQLLNDDVDGHVLSLLKFEYGDGGAANPGREDIFYGEGHQVMEIGAGVLLSKNLFNNYAPTLGTNPDQYAVNPNDTLASIALSVYGDASLWYVIAEANGLGYGPSTAVPSTDVGRSYRIPNIVANVHNTANTFKPFNAAEIVGDITPSPQQPAPPSCNQVEFAIATVVSTAISIAASTFLPPGVGTFVGGVGSDLAQQTIGIAWGTQSGFNLNEFAAAGLQAALSAGVDVGVNQAVKHLQDLKLPFAGAQQIGTTLAKKGAGWAFGEVSQALFGTGPFSQAGRLAARGGIDPAISSLAAAGISAAFSIGVSELGGGSGSHLDSGSRRALSTISAIAANSLNPSSGWLLKDNPSWSDILNQTLSPVANSLGDYAASQWLADSGSAAEAAAGAQGPSSPAVDPKSLYQGIVASASFSQPDEVGAEGADPDYALEWPEAWNDHVGFWGEERVNTEAGQRNWEDFARSIGRPPSDGQIIAQYNGLSDNDFKPGLKINIPDWDEIDPKKARDFVIAEYAQEARRREFDLNNPTRDPSRVEIEGSIANPLEQIKAVFDASPSLDDSYQALLDQLPYYKGANIPADQFGKTVPVIEFRRSETVELGGAAQYVVGTHPDIDEAVTAASSDPDVVDQQIVLIHPEYRSLSDRSYDGLSYDHFKTVERYHINHGQQGNDSLSSFFSYRGALNYQIAEANFKTGSIAEGGLTVVNAIQGLGGFLVGPEAYLASLGAGTTARYITGLITDNQDAQLIASVAASSLAGSYVSSFDASVSLIGPGRLNFKPVSDLGNAASLDATTSAATKGRAPAVEFAGGTQTYVPDLSHVTGSGAASRNKAIDAIIKEDFPGINFTYKPEYSPFISSGVAQEGAGTQIGKNMFSSRNDLRDTIIHEELHQRWWNRGIYDHHPRGSEMEARFYGTIDRYFRMRGWKQ